SNQRSSRISTPAAIASTARIGFEYGTPSPSREIAPEAISQAARRIGPYFGLRLKIDIGRHPPGSGSVQDRQRRLLLLLVGLERGGLLGEGTDLFEEG